MRPLRMLLGASIFVVACESAPDKTPAPPINPEALVGNYELWVCATADCGPAAQAPGSRIGRLQLTVERVPMTASDSTVSYHGCATIGPLVKVDTATALTPVRWHPGETAGRVMFGLAMEKAEYEISLDDLGGIMRGQARWRRDGIISEEAPEYVVARRSVSREKLACAMAPAVAAPIAEAKPKAKTAKGEKAGTRPKG